MTHPNVEAKLWEEQTYVKQNFLLQQNLGRAKRCRQQMLFIHVFLHVQGVFLHWASPKRLKYGKPRLGESTLTQIAQDTPNLAQINFSVLRHFRGRPSKKNTLYIHVLKIMQKLLFYGDCLTKEFVWQNPKESMRIWNLNI